MKSIFYTIAATLLLVATVSQLHSQEKKHLSYEQIFKNAEPRLTKSLPTVIGWADDNHYLEMKKKDTDSVQKVYAVDVINGKDKVFRDLSIYKHLVGEDINPSAPETHNDTYTKLIYIKEHDLYFLDASKKIFKRLTESEAEEKTPIMSPDAIFVAFTRNNDLYIIDLLTGEEKRHTHDGSDVIYNGWASWVYYEEIFGRSSEYRAFWWSPDSRTLVFYRFDDSKVPVFPLFSSEGVHGSLENTRYPKAGDPNPEVRIGIIHPGDSQIRWADFNEKLDQYFGAPIWIPNGKEVIVQWMNRQQDTLILYSIDPQSGRKRAIYTEHQQSWIDWFESIYFLKDNNRFILRSDKDGWSHLYITSMDGSVNRQLTSGSWNVSSLLFVDEKNGFVYFTARKEASTQTDFYKITLDGQNLARLTFGESDHSVRLSPNGKYFITTYSNLSTPSKMALFTTGGKLVRDIADSKTKEFDDYHIAYTELFRVKTPDGYDLPVTWILPTDFKENNQYPVLINIYGGPNSETVSNSWGGLRSQWLAMEGVIQISIDHRGSGHFGKAGVALMHRNLGKWEMNDYIEVVKWLREKPFVDSTKICITGGSYGGYVACLALTYGADYFTHGLALFSVTDYRLYDSHYTERYMDTPEENPEGYKNGSAMTYADRYKGMLRIVHGTMDDNVHMQNSIQLIDKLQDLKKHFEFMIYPGGRHGWGGPKAAHLRSETYRFYYTYLLEKEFPENLFK